MEDPNVLAAQEWVNKTYSGVAQGYVRCAEDGSTGWETVLSLTQGLQHELGISPTVRNFGPGTFSALEARGGIRPSESNANIVRIVNYALWCKGYPGASPASRWTSTTTDSMNDLIGDAGLSSAATMSNIPTRLLVQFIKALLRMDQFRRVPGGTTEIRSFQQHLNLNYVYGEDITTMDLSPCDGFYSRDVQQAVMKALQFEIGIPRPEIGGYFGANTKAKLKEQPTLSVGSSGDLVHLFTALCVFNSPVVEGEGETTTAIRREYIDKTESFVRAFQKFSQLSVTGKSNFDTWAQLLVSTGNELRATTACDEAEPLTFARAQALSRAGFQIVGRYLDEHLPPEHKDYLGKALTSAELSDILRGGLKVYPIFQWNAKYNWNFTYDKGFEQGDVAEKRAREFGFGRGTCIYFAVDFDATGADMDAVIDYFRGVRAALGRKNRYTYGIYGSRNVCSTVTRRVGATWSFVSGLSWGFSGNLGYPLPANWSFNQIRNGTFSYGSGSFGEAWEIDRNVWRRFSDPGTSVLNPARSAAQDFIDLIQRLFTEALEYNPAVDPYRLVCVFFRQEKYSNLAWRVILESGIDEGWIEHLAAQGITLAGKKHFTDPVTGAPIGTEHLMATLEMCLRSPGTADRVTVGDMGGWAGDLASFYEGWRTVKEQYPNPMLYAQDYLGRRDTVSKFSNDDWVQDTDAFNIMRLIRTEEINLPTAFARYYGTDSPAAGDRVCQRRYTQFFRDRFSSDIGRAQTLARNMLLGVDSDIEVRGGSWFLSGGWSLGGEDRPANIASDLLTGFVLAYAFELAERADAEKGI
ncbi:glycoside hydrolase domain-containing protein [Streptomyces sp. CC228A]|uniref:glycoside hydrolase domain-containing protein n=1 Tax=Streptomyces sp. CC228A TaxID=2898186 RepID=UPI001F2D5B52|nr:glycoside hydrolase domain-containing protein [Streptomyces sp. CC228A]